MFLRRWECSWVDSFLGNGPSWISCWCESQLCLQSHGSVSFPVPYPTVPTERCSEEECVARERCWARRAFKKSGLDTAVDTVMCFPDLSSLKDLFYQLLGGLSANSLQELPQLWRAVLFKVTSLLVVAYSTDWLMLKYKGVGILADLRTTLWGNSSSRVQRGFGWGCHLAWIVAWPLSLPTPGHLLLK